MDSWRDAPVKRRRDEEASTVASAFLDFPRWPQGYGLLLGAIFGVVYRPASKPKVYVSAADG